MATGPVAATVSPRKGREASGQRDGGSGCVLVLPGPRASEGDRTLGVGTWPVGTRHLSWGKQPPALLGRGGGCGQEGPWELPERGRCPPRRCLQGSHVGSVTVKKGPYKPALVCSFELATGDTQGAPRGPAVNPA